MSSRIDDLIAAIPRAGWFVLAMIGSLAVLYVGSRPGSALPHLVLFNGFDKVEHFTAYSAIAACVYRWVFPLQPRGRAMTWPGFVVLIPSIVGMMDEINQGVTPGRSSSVGDWAADTSGAAVVLLLGLWFRR